MIHGVVYFLEQYNVELKILKFERLTMQLSLFYLKDYKSLKWPIKKRLYKNIVLTNVQ